MSRMDEAIQRIKEALDSGIDSSQEDWKIIFKECTGKDFIETLKKVQDIIAEKFSFFLKRGCSAICIF